MTKQKREPLTKEEVDKRFADRQERVKARRAKKLTGQNVEQSLSTRKMRRSSRRRPGRTGNIVAGVFVLAAIVTAVISSLSANTFARQADENTALITQLRMTLTDFPTSEGASDEYRADLEAQIADAITKGETVATLQQGFTEILGADSAATNDEGNGGPDAAFAASVEHRRELAPYFIERSLLVGDDLAYVASSIDPFEADQVDPRFPWFAVYGPDGSFAVPSTSLWSLAGIATTDSSGVLRAVWTCTDTVTGDLLAWAVAEYYIDAGAFGDLRTGTTTLGQNGIVPLNGTTDEEVAP